MPRSTATMDVVITTAEQDRLEARGDAGRVVERGTYAELIEAGGTYAGLYRSRLGNVRASSPR